MDAFNYLSYSFDSEADSEENLTSCDDSDYSSLDSDVEDICDTETIAPDGINYSSVNGEIYTTLIPTQLVNYLPATVFCMAISWLVSNLA